MNGVALGVSMAGPSITPRQVEVTQAYRQTGVTGFMPQRRGLHSGEGAWAEGVSRQNLAVCKKREVGIRQESSEPSKLLISGLISIRSM